MSSTSTLGPIIDELWAVIESRRDADPEGSYTARLLSGHEDQLLKKIAEDKVAFTRAFNQSLGPRRFADNFQWPRPRQLTAPFGDLRLFNGKKQSQHFGVDLEGKVGEPNYAANEGTVVMVRECYASGGTVLIHHGANLFTAYFHISKFTAHEGQEIKRGEQVGLVGKSGRVTGPHLHFGVKVAGLWVNAETLLQLDFE